MDNQYVLFEKRDTIAIVTINRPEALNALNRTIVNQLDRLVDEVASDRNIRVVIFTGVGNNFAAGADIKEMMEGTPEFARSFSFKDTYAKIESLEIPTIAAIDGYALGGGLELALACDFRIATGRAKMGSPEITLGIFPGAGGTQRLPRLIGTARAKEMIMFGSIVDAAKALSYGLVNWVVEESLHEEAFKLAGKLSKLPPIAMRQAKQLIQQAWDCDLKTGMEFEAVTWTTLFATEDQKEGMRAFQEKRKAVFTGK